MNLASRIESAAQPGTIYISASVQTYISGFSWEPAGSFALKGISGPTVLYRLIAKDLDQVA